MDDNPKGGCGKKTTTLFMTFICVWQTSYKLITHNYRVTEILQQTHCCGKGNQGEGKR